MKEYKPDLIRNLAFIGHGGSGKTSISENILFIAGEINRIGRVEEGNTTSDFSPNEIERQISISASPIHLEWKGKKINILDTPGYSDFLGQVRSSLHVTDSAVLVLKGAEGVEVGSEVSWDLVKEFQLPSAIIINKLDNEHSDFDKVIKIAKERLSPDVTIISFPVDEGINFSSVVDVIKMKKITFGEPGSNKTTETNLEGDFLARAESLREELIEKVAESSEDLMNKFFENGTLDENDLLTGIRRAIQNNLLVPIFAVAAAKSAGFNSLLDFIADYFPSPLDRDPVKVKLDGKDTEIELPCDPDAKPAALIFKSMSEQHVGELSVFKVFSGTLAPGMDLINPVKNKHERIGQLYILNGKNRKEVSKLVAGDIGAVVKLKDTHTSDTLSSKEFPVILDPIKLPEPVIRGAIKPKAKGDEDKISTGLHAMHEEDPTLQVQFDPELSQTIVSGQGELQLSLAVKLLKDRYHVDVDIVEPKIPYRETINGSCMDAEYKHKKQSGGRGQFGHVHLKVEPMPRGEGFEFVNAIVGGVVPARFIPAVEKGVRETMEKGILTGSKVVDIRVTLFDGKFHTVDSDEISFKIAGSQAFRKGFREAKPLILEPIYKIMVKVPEEYMGDVMGDISSRRGKISGMDTEGPFQIIKALIPLADLYKYSTNLRSLTSGRGLHTRELSHYEQVPKEIENKIIDDYQKSREEE